MNYEITGKLHLREDEIQISDTFKKREFVLFVQNDQNIDWSDYIKFQLIQDRTDLIDKTQLGDMITVHFNIRGREWTKDGKTSYFNSLDAWKIVPENTEPKTLDERMSDEPEQEGDSLPF